MLCARCDQPIRPGQSYTTYDHHSASAGGATIHMHSHCPRSPHQAVQEPPLVLPAPEPRSRPRRR